VQFYPAPALLSIVHGHAATNNAPAGRRLRC
jgi:hypothetical protein